MFCYSLPAGNEKLRFWLGYVLLYLGAAWVIVYWFAQQSTVRTESLILLLFYVLLPLLNVLWDWLSIGVTRSLLYAIADKVHGGRTAFVWALLDVLLALVFLAMVSLTITAGIAFTNRVAQWGGADSIVDLQLLFDNLRLDALHPDYWWLHLMALSTLVPTFIHMVIAAASVLLWIPRHTLQKLTQNWRDEQHKFDLPKFALAASYLVIIAPLAVIAPLALLYALFHFLVNLGGAHTVGMMLLDILQTYAAWLDPQVLPVLSP